MDDARSATVKHYDSDLKKLAKRMHASLGRGVAVEDLEQLGRIGLVRALERYQPALGSRDAWLLTQAEWAMRVGARTEYRQSRYQRIFSALNAAPDSEDRVERLTGKSTFELKAIAFMLADATHQHGPNPEEAYCTEESRALLPPLIARLPDERPRRAMEILLSEKMTAGELATAWNISPSRVSRLVREGIEQAKALLPEL